MRPARGNCEHSAGDTMCAFPVGSQCVAVDLCMRQHLVTLVIFYV